MNVYLTYWTSIIGLHKVSPHIDILILIKHLQVFKSLVRLWFVAEYFAQTQETWIADVYIARVTPNRRIQDGVATGQKHKKLYYELQVFGLFWWFNCVEFPSTGLFWK